MNMKAPKCLFDPEHMHSHALPQQVNENNADFSEYMWMGEEDIEQFDQQVEEELWEEMFLEACFEQMLAEEEEQENVNYVDNVINSMNGLQIDLSRPPPPTPSLNNFYNSHNQVNSFYTPPAETKPEDNKQERAVSSALNPEAPEFVPRYLRS